MSDSIRQQICDNLKEALETITVLNGYASDIGTNVEEQYTTAIADNRLPVIVFTDPQCIVSRESGMDNKTLKVDIDIIIDGADEREMSKRLRSHAADVCKCLFNNINMGGTIDDIEIEEEGEIFFHEKDRLIGFAIVKANFIYESVPGDDYRSSLNR